MRTVFVTCLFMGIFPVVFCSFESTMGVGAEAPPKAVGVEPFTPSPDFFPILCWGTIPPGKQSGDSKKNGLESIADCNFTVAGFVNPDDLPSCERLGLTAIVRSYMSEGLNDNQIEEKIRKITERTANSKAVLGYYITDEPGASVFPTVAKYVAAVKKYAPEKLAFVDVGPTGGPVRPGQAGLCRPDYTKYLEQFVRTVKPQFLAYDNYMVQYSNDMQDKDLAATYFGNLLEIRRVAQKHDLPFWNIVASHQIRKVTTIPSPANLALQAYTTLAAGGRGLSWFLYYRGAPDWHFYAPIDLEGNRTETWRYLQVVNRQVRTLGPIMNRLRSTGVFFSSSRTITPLPLLPGRVVTQVPSKASVTGITQVEPPIMVGEFTDAQGIDYAMIVNLSLERSANIKIDTAKAYKSRQTYSAEDGRLLPLDDTNGHWLLAGHGVLVKLQ